MPQIVPIRGIFVQHHLIISKEGVDLIDGGFIFGIRRLRKTLAHHGKTLSDIRSLFLTHGHLDHTLNVAKLQKLTGCRVYAPEADRNHINGIHHYQGWSRVCGWLERIGRLLLRFNLPKVDHWFAPGEVINGLEIISLPGHTVGHCGFLLENEQILFAGDLFACHFRRPSPPPTILNDDSKLGKETILKAAQRDLCGVILNHAAKMSPREGLESLRSLAQR